MRSNNLPHPSTLSNSDWATPHEAVTNPLSLLLNTGHLLGGLIGNTFSMNSNPADQSWDETRYFHYCQTDRPWKASSLYRQYRRDTLKDVKVNDDVAYYLSYLDKTGEFAPQTQVQQTNDPLAALVKAIADRIAPPATVQPTIDPDTLADQTALKVLAALDKRAAAHAASEAAKANKAAAARNGMPVTV